MNDKLSLDQLNVHFGAAHAVKDVTMEMPANSVTAIIGPSGCGKSTVLRAINRMHDQIPTARVAGRVLLDGAAV